MSLDEQIARAQNFYDSLSKPRSPRDNLGPPVEATGVIRIVQMPEGQAPDEIKMQWIGLELPCHPFEGYPDQCMDEGVLDHNPVERNERGFSVPQDKAIEALEAAGRTDAARWWRDRGFPIPDGLFGFDTPSAEIVSGVTSQVVTPMDDLDYPRGFPAPCASCGRT